MILPVILSGGSGTRLWPLSRELYPKQLLALCGPNSMLQETVKRLDGLADCPAPLVVCNEEHRFIVAEQLRGLDVQARAIVLEPVARNTAPAVTLAALYALADGDDPMLLVLPADHVIEHPEAFRAAVETARPLAERGHLVTFGVTPDRPETGYGYIKAANVAEADAGERPGAARRVERFVEKPDAETAKSYLASGDYTWNSGMFLFRASRVLEEMSRFAPTVVDACRGAIAGAETDMDFLRPQAAAFRACPAESIDYAVMEKTDAAMVVPLDAGWNDIGSWAALWGIGPGDGAGNVCHGDVITEDSEGCYLFSSGRLVAAVGLRGHIVVETGDAVLVAAQDRAQDVKRIVERLKREERREHLLHRRVTRPWGAYEEIDAGDRFQVKRLTVNPGARLSLQYHHHRAEHWVVVRGTARITCGEEIRLLGENESTYIPLGVRHRLENPGRVVLEIIEVQSGSYLGEDDIVRLEDQYGRR